MHPECMGFNWIILKKLRKAGKAHKHKAAPRSQAPHTHPCAQHSAALWLAPYQRHCTRGETEAGRISHSEKPSCSPDLCLSKAPGSFSV